MNNNKLRILSCVVLGAIAAPQSAIAFFNTETEQPAVQRATAAYVPAVLSKQAVVSLAPSFGVRSLTSAGSPSGLSAGDKTSRSGNAWMTVGATTYDTNLGGGVTYDADIYNLIAGYDFSYRKDLVLGVAFTYERSRSIGSLSTDSTREGFGIVPYIGIKLSDTLILDASIGWAPSLDGRLADSTGTLTATPLHPDTNRTQASINLNGYVPVDNKVMLSWHTGINYSRDKTTNGLSATNGIDYGGTNTLGQGYLRGQVTYYGGDIETYVSLEYDYDFDNPEDLSTFNLDEDDDQFILNVGMNVKFSSSGVLNLDFKMIEDRDFVDHAAFQASYSMPF